jgi:hypothetical protein
MFPEIWVGLGQRWESAVGAVWEKERFLNSRISFGMTRVGIKHARLGPLVPSQGEKRPLENRGDGTVQVN